jgi:hypothetical protein
MGSAWGRPSSSRIRAGLRVKIAQCEGLGWPDTTKILMLLLVNAMGRIQKKEKKTKAPSRLTVSANSVVGSEKP